MSKNITVMFTEDEIQYLLNSMDSHVKAHGLGVTTGAAILLTKLKAAANDQPMGEPDPERADKLSDRTE